MGLDTSHGCWEGPYSAFMRYRTGLHGFILAARKFPDGVRGGREGYIAAIDANFYADETDPLNFFMQHSDCDGEIPPEMCGPLADALQALMDRHMPERAMYDELRPATQRWITGLRAAAAAHEPVRFF